MARNKTTIFGNRILIENNEESGCQRKEIPTPAHTDKSCVIKSYIFKFCEIKVL